MFLVRHASHGLLGRTLAGRMPGVSLSEAGRREAERLGDRLARENIGHVWTGPLERARETGAAITARLGCPSALAPALDEIDCGAWTGQSFDELSADPRWRMWNECRAEFGTPGGETMRAVQHRAIGFVRDLAASRDGAVALVSHGDVIKAIVMAILSMSLDRHDSFAIDPASLTLLHCWPGGARVVRLNEVLS